MHNNRPRLNAKLLCKQNNNVSLLSKRKLNAKRLLELSKSVSLHSKLNKLVSPKHNVKLQSKNVFVSKKNNAALHNNRPKLNAKPLCKLNNNVLHNNKLKLNVKLL